MNGWIAAGSYIIIHRHGPLAQWLEQATHNRLVVGSNPTGATKQNKELDEKSSDSFFFGCDLGQVMGQVRNCYPALFISLPASPDSDESQ